MCLSASSIWSPIGGGVTAPNGFKASAIKAGLKVSQKPDLALLVVPEDSICAGTFTNSLVRAACVDLCRERLKNVSGKVRAVLINSGQANACIGEQGLIDSLRASKELADSLGIMPEKVLMCSTGVIGMPIPMNKLIPAIKPLVEGLSFSGGSDAAIAILTTDLREKQFAFHADLDGRQICIGGMAKGSGMIHPNMATMLGYLTCDALIPTSTWQAMITRVVDSSFNSITVDGDTSTNDSVLAFASGDPLPKRYWDVLESGLTILAQNLAKAIARDGEGANCLLEVEVQGADNSCDARQIARTICSSSLVKTAVHGCDPNWGRIIGAAGRSGINFNPKCIELWIGPYQLIVNGEPVPFDKESISSYMRQRFKGAYLVDDTISIRLKVGAKKGSGFAWGCDLSEKYIRINADYTT